MAIKQSKMADLYAASLATALVAEIIDSAIEKLINLEKKGEECILEEAENIDWPTGADFTQEVGLKSVEEFIGSWPLHDSWKYCINYLGVDGERYQYQVLWSIPTRRKPVPRATASVYFTLVLQQQEQPVAVFYKFEGQKLVHRPGQSKFREVWLRDILASKAAVLESIQV